MKIMKKVGAIILAIMMIAMVGAAYAASNPPEKMNGTNGVIGAFTQPDTPVEKKNVVNLSKALIVYNQDEGTVNAPTVTYTFEIITGSAGKSVADKGTTALHETGSSVGVLTKAGITGATIGNVALTPSTTLNASAEGAVNTFPIPVDFSAVEWPGAGVYRYQINETTTDANKVAAGILDTSTVDTVYLDVYVKDGSTSGTYEIYGYVCFANNNDINGTSTDSVAAAKKIEGFVSVDADNDGTVEETETADKYYTFNVEVSKTLTGDQAMNGHEFPFNVDFTNNSVTAVVKPIIKKTGTPGATEKEAGVNGLDDTPTIANGEKVKYIGIPVGIDAGTTVAVKEYNDVTGTVYKYTHKVDTANASTAATLNPSTSASPTWSTEATLSITKNAADTTAHTIAFTNILEQISPTGYVSRVAPYLAMLVGGIALFVIFAVKRRKNTVEE